MYPNALRTKRLYAVIAADGHTYAMKYTGGSTYSYNFLASGDEHVLYEGDIRSRVFELPSQKDAVEGQHLSDRAPEPLPLTIHPQVIKHVANLDAEDGWPIFMGEVRRLRDARRDAEEAPEERIPPRNVSPERIQQVIDQIRKIAQDTHPDFSVSPEWCFWVTDLGIVILCEYEPDSEPDDYYLCVSWAEALAPSENLRMKIAAHLAEESYCPVCETNPCNGSKHYFGVCPICHHTDGYINDGHTHIFICESHKTKWTIGVDLFSDCMYETPEQQRAVMEKLGFNDYREVEPHRVP